ncbi:MAG: bifunctional oligoribonuclease/PAP phosphatase NrnA [Anaerolineae bacterium]|nr:bifunctional oligoribonuclease/PAP phosphatase NrnA [Anaerolineae bacterium]
MDRTLLETIAECIEPARRVLVVTHVAPDGDAIGSLLALGRLLAAQGKGATLVCQDPVPQDLMFLPGSERVVQKADGPYDVMISLDCSDRQRMGDLVDKASAPGSAHDLAAVPLINIDHHVTNTLFGTANWVDPNSVATAQMVLALADALGWDVDPETATCLLCGLVTDTRSFRTMNVDEAAIAAALRLMRAGAPLPQVARQSLDLRPLASVRLWGDAVNHLQLDDGILWTAVTVEMRRRWGVDDKDVSGLANSLSGVREAQVIIVFTERENGEVDVSMRSAPDVDVAHVALSLDGGGHPQAAGATLQGTLREVQERVLARVRLSLAEQASDPSTPRATG